MLGSLNSDIMGTNPQYLKIVDHDWLDVKKGEYDNYPSENNSVRTLPELAKQWGHGRESGISLIPNIREVPHMASVEDTDQIKRGIVKAVKKAMMMGMVGKDLANDVRSKFGSDFIAVAKDELSKLSEEQGLLGHVYVDGSVFSTVNEAESFFKKYPNRLAKYMLVDESQHTVLERVAHQFKKKMITAMEYNQDVYNSYRDHLVATERIPLTFDIDSKESLRKAFLYKNKPAEISEVKAHEATTKITEDFTSALLEKKEAEKKTLEAMEYEAVKPVLRYMQEQMMTGSLGDTLKKALRNKFTPETLKTASKYLASIIARQGFQGTVFADLELYKNCEEGHLSIKATKTNISYVKEMSKCSGCLYNAEGMCSLVGLHLLNKDKGIDPKIASSYIDDLVFNRKLTASEGRNFKEEVSQNAPLVIKTAFLYAYDQEKIKKAAEIARVDQNQIDLSWKPDATYPKGVI